MSKIKGKILELAEAKNGNYFDLTGRICYLNSHNINGLKLNYSEKTEESVKTIMLTPVVAYYDYDYNKGEDFTGHETYENYDGEMVSYTSAIGVHKKAWVQNDMVKPVFSEEEIELPCVYATARIWADRFPNYARVIKKLFNEGKLYSSFEVDTIGAKPSETKNEAINNPRETDQWEFSANCLLGSTVNPAYGKASKILEIASVEEDGIANKELAEALKKDLEKSSIDGKSKSDIDASASDHKQENSERGSNMKTVEELELKLAEKDKKNLELSTKVDELSEKIKNSEKAEVEKDNLEKAELKTKYVEATEKIQTLETSNTELSEKATKYDAVMAEKQKEEAEQKRVELKELATAGGYIEEKEFETSEELKKMLAECDESGIRMLKADRVLASVESEKKEKEKASADNKSDDDKAKRELSEEMNKGTTSGFDSLIK